MTKEEQREELREYHIIDNILNRDNILEMYDVIYKTLKQNPDLFLLIGNGVVFYDRCDFCVLVKFKNTPRQEVFLEDCSNEYVAEVYKEIIKYNNKS